MLARLLHLGGLDVTVFEGEATGQFRGQGGTLDLHTDTGLAAVKEAGLWDEFSKHGRYDGQYLALVDQDLHYYYVRTADEKSSTLGERPEIDRPKLREILINCLPEGMIQWNRHLERVDGRTLIFKDGSTASGFDLIVGADGAWSRVRASIAPNLKPQYLGVGMYELSIPDAQQSAPDVQKLAHRGSLYANSGGRRMTLQQMGDGSLHLYALFVRDSPDWLAPEKCGYDPHNHDQVKKALLAEYSDWCPELLDCIVHTQGSTPRSLYFLPIGEKWRNTPGVTLIGDAAHLMTPFAGEGVNQGLQDAMLLARTILQAEKESSAINDGVVKFEAEMMERVTKIEQLSYHLAQDWMFTPESGKASITKAMITHVRAETPSVLRPLVAAEVKTYMWFKSLMMK